MPELDLPDFGTLAPASEPHFDTLAPIDIPDFSSLKLSDQKTETAPTFEPPTEHYTPPPAQAEEWRKEEAGESPLFNLGDALIKPPGEAGSKTEEGINESLRNTLNGLTTPNNLALMLGSMGVSATGAAAKTLVSALWATFMGKNLAEHIPGQVQTLKEELGKPPEERDDKKIASTLTDFGVNTAFFAAPLVHTGMAARETGGLANLLPESLRTSEGLRSSQFPFRVEDRGATLDKMAADYEASRQPAEPASVEPPKPEETPVTPPVPEPKLVGMGGAIPEEFAPGGGSPTGMKFRLIDQERQTRGLEPLIKPDSVSDKTVWDKALAEIDKNPALPDELVQSILEKPRTIEDWENHVLLAHKIALRDLYEKSAKEAIQAYEDSQQFPERRIDMEEANLRTAALSDRLEAVEQASRLSGSARGRALRSLQVMANEDFSLASLERQKRAARGGAPITPDERAELQKIADEHRIESEKLQQHLEVKDKHISDLELKLVMDRVAREAAEPQIHPSILKIAEGFVKQLDTRADAARARILERAKRFGMNVDPTVLLDLAEIGASHLAHKILDFAKWSDKMIADVGEWVKPHLEQVYAASQKTIDAIAESHPEKATVAKIKEALPSSPEAIKGGLIEAIKEKSAKGETEKISWYVQKLARAFYSEGIVQRDAMVDALHSELRKAIPDITRRQTMDALSGYGDFKQLSKDKITVGLRGIKGELQQIAKLEDMAKGQPPLKSGVERRTPTEAERKLIKLVNDAKNKFQIPISDPATQLKSALDTVKTALKNRAADYQDRLDRKDYAPRLRSDVVLDKEALELKARVERIKKKFQEEVRNDRLNNRTNWEKALDWTTKYRRFSVLSSLRVFPKLLAAGLARLTTMPLEDIVSGTAGKLPVISEVAKRAPLEGSGWNVKAAMKGFAPAFMQGLKDAWSVVKSGYSDLDAIYGTIKETYTGEGELGSKLLALPGRLHGMVKAPVKRVAFERAVQRLGEFYANKGLDVTDPFVQARIGIEAYKAANRSIFLQDNFIASKISAFLSEKTDKATGHATLGSKLWATAGRFALPIVRVPTNIVAETFTYALGLPSSGLRIIAAQLGEGVKSLKPEQADVIMRELKKGSIGAAILALGYFASDYVGGYYRPNAKKKEGTPKFGSVKIAGVNVPSVLLHNPLLETLQLGATIRQVADSKLRKGDRDKQGIFAGIMAGVLGVVEHVPFVQEMVELDKLHNPYTRGRFIGEQAKSAVVPALVQNVADWTDPYKRKPRNIVEHIETGIPGLRQSVPRGKKKE